MRNHLSLLGPNTVLLRLGSFTLRDKSWVSWTYSSADDRSTLNYSQHCFKLPSCIKNCEVLKNCFVFFTKLLKCVAELALLQSAKQVTYTMTGPWLPAMKRMLGYDTKIEYARRERIRVHFCVRQLAPFKACKAVVLKWECLQIAFTKSANCSIVKNQKPHPLSRTPG